MGRKFKLTDELQEAIIGYVADGVPDETLCEAVGISKASFYNWLKWGAAFADGGKAGEVVDTGVSVFSLPKSGKTRLIEFFDAVTRARGDAKASAVKAVRSAINGQETVSEITETVTETRLKKDGTEYDYTKTVSKCIISYQPPDARIALDYLERRDPDNWSKRQKLEHVIELSPDVVALLEARGIGVSEVAREFEAMVRARAVVERE